MFLEFACASGHLGLNTRVFQKYKFSRFVNGDKNVAVYGPYEANKKSNWDYRGNSLKVHHLFFYTKKC